MKQILSEINGLIISDKEITVIAHPTTIFTDDNVKVNTFDKELFETDLTTPQVDEILNQVAEKNILVDVIELEDSPHSIASENAIEILVKVQEKILVLIDPEL